MRTVMLKVIGNHGGTVTFRDGDGLEYEVFAPVIEQADDFLVGLTVAGEIDRRDPDDDGGGFRDHDYRVVRVQQPAIELVQHQVFELLVLIGRSRAPRDWSTIRGELEGRQEMTDRGMLLVIATPLEAELNHLIERINAAPWRAEVITMEVMICLTAKKYAPYVATDAAGGKDAPSQLWARSLGALPPEKFSVVKPRVRVLPVTPEHLALPERTDD